MARKEGIKNIFGSFAGNTSAHGLGTLASAGSIKAKLLWSVICLASMGMFCFMVSRIVRQYLEFPTNVNVEEVRIFLL